MQYVYVIITLHHFLYKYEAEFKQFLLSTGRKQLASRFNFTYRYIDDVVHKQPIASLSHNLYDMYGPAPRMNVLFWWQYDFQIISNRDTSRNVWNSHFRSFMVETGILSNNMKYLYHEC